MDTGLPVFGAADAAASDGARQKTNKNKLIKKRIIRNPSILFQRRRTSHGPGSAPVAAKCLNRNVKIFFVDIKIRLQLHSEHRSVQITGYGNGSSVHIHNIFGDGKPQTGASRI